MPGALTELLESVPAAVGGPIPTTPIDILTTFAAANGHADVQSTIEGLKFLLELNTLQMNPLLTTPSSVIGDYDTLFGEIDMDFDVTVNGVDVDVSLPFISEFDTAVSAAGTNFPLLATISQNLTDTLTTLTATGPFGASMFTFDIAETIDVPIYEIDPRIPVYGATAPGFAAGVTVGGSINALVDYSIVGSIDLMSGLTLNSGEVALGIGITGDGSVGITLGSFTINAAELSATLSGEVRARLDTDLDTDMNGFQASELVGSCYYETIGGLRFRVDAEYLDPNPVNQVSSFVSGGGPAEKSVNLFNELIWSANLNSCEPKAANLSGGVLQLEGSLLDDVITLTLNNDNPADPQIVVDNNGLMESFPVDDIDFIEINSLDGADNVTIDPLIVVDSHIIGGPGNDTLLGGGGHDQINGDADSDTLEGGPGDDTVFGGAGDDVINSHGGADILLGEAGSDKFFVTPDPFWSKEVVGGDPTDPPGDILSLDLTGVSGAQIPRNVSEGAIGSLSHETVFFTEIETLIGSDRFEVNNTIETATDLGSDPFVTLRDLSIHNLDDADFFQIAAHDTGKLIVGAHFSHDIGDLDVRVWDSNGNVITEADSETDDELIVIPVVGQETYFVEVFGFQEDDECHLNNYSLEIENFAAPVPSGVHLDPLSDSGTLDTDHLTNDTTPRFVVEADLTELEAMDIEILSPSEADAMLAGTGTTPGAAVEVYVTNSTTGVSVRGFADQIGSSTILFDFTPDALDEGIYFVSAAVRIFDGQEDDAGEPDPATGRSLLSHPLWMTVDTTAPLKEIGDPGSGKSGLHPDSDSGVAGDPALFKDRITSDTTPTIFGRAEAGAIVRGFVVTGGGEVPIGVAVSVADTGNNSTLNGEWELTSNLHLNDPALGLGEDGERTLRFRAEDIAGNVTENMELKIFLDTQGPQVTDLQVTGSPAFDLFDVKPSQGPTPEVNALSVLVRDLPNRATGWLYNALQEGADGNPVENAGNYQVVGDRHGIIAIDSVAFTAVAPTDGNPATGTIQINFVDPLPDDRFTLTVSDAIADPAGNALDGESDASQPNGNPTFPSGDGQTGGDFVARFTVDTGAEIGIWAAGSVYVDTNGNFSFDPQGSDSANQDLVYTLGFTTDNVFAGNFLEAADGTADGFDKVASYGRVAGSFRWLVDVNNDSVIDLVVADPAQQNGLPVAGDFDGDEDNGDEVGLKNDVQWFLDTDHNFMVDTTLTGDMIGYPFVGDFDGDGVDDLGAWADDTFSLDLSSVLTGAAAAGSYDANINGIADVQFRFGFPGVRERPFAADFDGDGHDDIGLWAPDRSGAVPAETGEWYIFISGDDPIANRIELNGGGVHGNPDLSNENYIPFTPAPFGHDVFARFGDDFALPVVGNFDPPVTQQKIETTLLSATNPENPLDVNNDGHTSPVDALWMINELNARGSRPLDEVIVAANYQELAAGAYLDPSGDGFLSPIDSLLVINFLNGQSIAAAAEGEDGVSEVDPEASSVVTPPTNLPFIGASVALPASASIHHHVGARVAVEERSTFSDRSVWQVPTVEPDQLRDDQVSAGDEWESLLDELAGDVAAEWKRGAP